jgi:hypothetical protein
LGDNYRFREHAAVVFSSKHPVFFKKSLDKQRIILYHLASYGDKSSLVSGGSPADREKILRGGARAIREETGEAAFVYFLHRFPLHQSEA